MTRADQEPVTWRARLQSTYSWPSNTRRTKNQDPVGGGLKAIERARFLDSERAYAARAEQEAGADQGNGSRAREGAGGDSLDFPHSNGLDRDETCFTLVILLDKTATQGTSSQSTVRSKVRGLHILPYLPDGLVGENHG